MTETYRKEEYQKEEALAIDKTNHCARMFLAWASVLCPGSDRGFDS